MNETKRVESRRELELVRERAGRVHAARVRASGKGYVVIVTARRLIHAGDSKEHLSTG